MSGAFYAEAGSLISPGDLFDRLPYIRMPSPVKVARKYAGSLPKRASIQGELREVFEVGKHSPNPDFNFEPPGEEVISNGKMAMAIFLTWGSEVEDDERSGKLHKKDWLIAPVFPLADLEGIEQQDSSTGAKFRISEAIRAGKSPRYFPLQPIPQVQSSGYYADFRKIVPLAATHFKGLRRKWRLAPPALNDFYHQLIWFFTRKKIFFEPIRCARCGEPVDLGVVFEGQSLDPEEPSQ